MGALLSTILASILLPPFCLILTAGIGIVVWRWRPRLGRALSAASFLLLWLVSTTAFNAPFLEALGWPVPADARAADGARAIVVLGGGVTRKAPEYGGLDIVHVRTLDRLRYAAWLARQTGLPLLTSGGRHEGTSASEAELMKSVLENEFATPVRWIEVNSMNTFENARESARILREAGIDRIFLVTHSFHMRRAVQAFAPTGIQVIPAPMSMFSRDPMTFAHFLPGPVGIQTSYYVAHELLGRAWYAIRERFE